VQKIIYIFLALLFIAIALLFGVRVAIDKQNVSYVLDKLSLTLESEIKAKKVDTLKMAIAISKNSALIEALKNEDEALGYKLLSELSKDIKASTGVDTKAQVLTYDYHIFARSWDDIYAGMPLEDYRSDLLYFASHKTPRSSIEIGRLLSIKTTVPIYEDEQLIGFVEIIGFFDSIVDFFRKIGVDLYVLMDDKYYDMAVFMQDNETIDRYIVANRNYNHNNLSLLRKVDFKELKINKLVNIGENYIFSENMRDSSSQTIGLFVFVLNQRYVNYFKDQNDDTSFFINLTKKAFYDVVAYEKSDSYLEDRVYGRYGADMKTLNTYTKEQLIELLLKEQEQKRVRGKLR